MDAQPRRRRSHPETAPAVVPSFVRIMDDKRNAPPPFTVGNGAKPSLRSVAPLGVRLFLDRFLKLW